MLKFQEKRKLLHIFFSKTTIILLLIAVILMGYAAFNAYKSEQEAIASRVLLSDEIVRLEERGESIYNLLLWLDDPRGVEAELRRRFDAAKEGEEVIVLVEKETEIVPQISTNRTKPTFIERLRQFFSRN